MDTNNWLAAQTQISIPSQSMNGEGVAGPGMEASDWRTQLQADSRQRIVNKILETLKRHLPFSGLEGLQELQKIAVRFEEKIYTAALNQSDYLRKISLKMLTMENKSQNPVAISLQSNNTINNKNPQDPASQTIQSQMQNQGQPLPLPMVTNQSQVRQPLLSQNIHNNLTSGGATNSGSFASALPGGGMPQVSEDVLCIDSVKLRFLRGTTIEDQKKRTQEALERRFARAKKEFDTQQRKGKKIYTEDKNQVSHTTDFSTVDKVVKKSFFKTSSRKDAEVNEPAYFDLLHPVNEKLLPSCTEISDKNAKVDGILHELFKHGDFAQKYIQGSKSLKIENTILLDNYVPKGGMFKRSRVIAEHNSLNRSKKHMSLKRHKKQGTFELPEEFLKFEIFKPMHEKWKSYMLELLKIVGKDQLAQCFLDADLHGAIILVVQCKVDSYVGVYGIMIRETAETFGILTTENQFRVVPKKLSVFMLQADCWKITLLGDRLASRSSLPRK